MWTTAGQTWAFWLVPSYSYRYLGRRARQALAESTRAALLAAGTSTGAQDGGGEAMILSVAARLDPVGIADSMIRHVDLDSRDRWAQAVETTLDHLEEIELYRRMTFLGVRLPTGRTRDLIGAAATDLAVRFLGVPPSAVRRTEVDKALAKAATLTTRLARHLPGIRPATGAELLWLYERAPRRGFDESPPINGDTDSYGAVRLLAVTEALLDEGGKTGPDKRSWLRRQYLRTETAEGAGYQCFSVLSDLPRRFTLDGGEWFAAADMVPFPVDWCARVRMVDNRTAQAKVKRHRAELAGQFDQHDDDHAGLPAGLADALEDADDELARLEANRGEPELHTTLIYSVWAEELDECESRSTALADLLGTDEYALHRPTGGQRGLFTAMLPAAPLPSVVRQYTQYFLAEDLAAGMPFAGTQLGDPYGALIGYSMDCGAVQPVLLDLSYGPRTNRSGATALVGDLGAGKSYTLKSLVWTTVTRGGAAVLLDRTDTGEYVTFSASLPGKTQVVRLAADAEISLDPLRVFTGDERVRVTKGFLTILLGHDPRSPEGLAVAEAVTATARIREPTLTGVVDELTRCGSKDPAARLAARQLAHLLGEELARLVAGDQPALNIGTGADAVIFHLPGLRLPDRVQLENEQLAKRLLPEQILAQALLYLVVAVMRAVAFSDPGRFAVAGLDEVGFLTSSIEGQQLLYEFVRDSRKHGAAPLIGAQTVEDLPQENLRGLITNRLLFRTDATVNVRDGLEFLGVEPDTVLVETARRLQTGQALLRDVDGRIGRVLLVPPDPGLDAVFSTTPDFSDSTPQSETERPAD
ncbi:ATP-binding protein [Actinomadura barringtoniae]|uniref:ATP-binding protein n=1 Tax=Actinomadura barringtoniae TaxID=1427535 RepID=A0A939T4V0_9ACTN|nr:ATP-binding protein [Actinomadura barringtoniae]MBO2448719.1 ATP-binding protein [Actinomadura barringtoniae]